MVLTVVGILFLACILQVVWLIFAVLGFRVAGIHLRSVKLFSGPALIKFFWNALNEDQRTSSLDPPPPQVQVIIGTVPLAASVDMIGNQAEDVFWNKPNSFSSQHPLVRVATLLAPFVGVLLLAVILLGPQDALHHLLTGPGQLVLSGMEERERLCRAFLHLPLLPMALGVLAAKFVALNLMPLGFFMAGGRVVFELLRWKRDVNVMEWKTTKIYLVVGTVGTMILGGLWLWAFVSALRS